MGLFTRSSSSLNWIQVTDENQINEILSSEGTYLLFKHSTRCSISSMALNRFENEFKDNTGVVNLYFVDLIQFRSVSNLIAEKTGVQHESPQVIVLKNGTVMYSASHGAINAEAILEKIKNA